LRNRDAMRLLGKLEAWFLRQYDLHHAAAMIQHADNVAKGRVDADAILSRHNTPNYVAALVAIASPFAAAAFFYASAPRVLGANVFDLLCAFDVLLVNLAVPWFLFWRFLWRRELTVFHAAVPRVIAGIIVGYLPIFFI